MSLPAIHRHIRVLEQAQLITRKKIGRVNFLAINRKGLLLLQTWTEQFNTYWGAQKETLENYVDGIERAEKRTKEKK